MSRTKRKDFYNDYLVNDTKPWYKPNSTFKKLAKKSRRAKERDALRHDPDNIPEFPMEDCWNWN